MDWTADDPSTTYDPANDASGTPGSGSAKSTNSSATTLAAISQCIAAGPGVYTYGAKVLIPSGQSVTGSGHIAIAFYSDTNCFAGFLYAAPPLSSATVGSFQTLSATVTAPAGTTHIWISGQNRANSAGTHIVNFDDFVIDNGSTPVRLQSFDVN
jgi:hypothetical protein